MTRMPALGAASARLTLTVMALFALGSCGPGISDGPSPHPITDEELRTWVTSGTTLTQVESSLARRKPYSVHEPGSETWPMILSYIEAHPDLQERKAISRAMESYPKLLLHATHAQTTWIFFDSAGVAKETFRTPNSASGAPVTGAGGGKAQQ